MRRFAPQLFAQLFCISLVLFSFSQSQGQTRPVAQPKVSNPHWPVEVLRQQQQARVQSHRQQQLQALSALRNDFRQLQIVNNNLMVRVFDRASNEKITNKEIRSSLGEIKKLAERVGYAFAIPKIKPNPETEVDLAAGLRQLDKAVMSFVHNPLFQQSRIYDAENASQAGRDLSDVLRLTNVLRKLTKQD